MKKKKQQLPHGFLIDGKIPLVEVPLKEVPAKLYNALKDKDFDLKTSLDKYEKEVIMKEEDKFYVPTIEEFHVGFEYEELCNGEWCKQAPFPDMFYELDFERIISSLIEIKEIRVKYLDREDIENLGWKESEKPLIYTHIDVLYFTKDGYKLCKNLKDSLVYINTIDTMRCRDTNGEYRPRELFCGTIKNKSELKTLMKWLNING